jgi:hypothetical protein
MEYSVGHCYNWLCNAVPQCVITKLNVRKRSIYVPYLAVQLQVYIISIKQKLRVMKPT